MFFYWIFWLVFLLLFYTWKKNNRKAQDQLISIIIVIIAFLVGCRVNVGADWNNYVYEYYHAISYVDNYREPLFLLIEIIMSKIGLPHPWFLFLLALVQMFCLKKAAQLLGIELICLVFFLFFSLFFCNTTLNILRQGLMVALIWLGLAYKSHGNTKKYIICIILAIGMHYVAIVLFPILFFVDIKINKKMMLGIILVSFIALITNLSNIFFQLIPDIALIEDKMSYYTSDLFVSESTDLSIGQIFDLFILVFTYFKFNRLYYKDIRVRILINSLLLSFVISCILLAYGIFAVRFSQVFKFALIFIIPYLYSEYFENRYNTKAYGKAYVLVKLLVVLILTSYAFLYMNKTLNSPDPTGYKEFHFKPYKVEISNYF